MSRVVGARIDDLLYNKLKATDRPNTVIIREALAQYLFKGAEKNDVNTSKTAVNNKKTNDESLAIEDKVDLILKRLKKKNLNN